MVRAAPKGASEVTLTRSLEPIQALFEIKSPVAKHPAARSSLNRGFESALAVIERAGQTITTT
jgi:hypothetical protein